MFVPEIERDSMPKQNASFLFGTKALSQAYAPIFDNYKDTISVPHIVAIVHLLGRTHLPMLVNECLRNMDLKIKSVIGPYVTELVSGLPKSLKLPQFHYGTAACHAAFKLKLDTLIAYPDLKSEVFRHFKEMGNILVLLLKFDQVLKQYDLKTFAVACAALGVTPESLQRKSTDEQAAQAPLINVLRNSTNFLQSFPDCICSPSICRLLAENAVRADKMYRQPDQTISLFSTILRLVSSMIDESRPEWCAYDHKPANGVIDVEAPYEFYRLWCALQFVLCMPEDDIQNLAMYGDGINWAACTIIYLLGQRNRFEAFSFTNHTLDIEDASKTRTQEKQLVQFLRNAVYDREVNGQIFSTLETYLDSPSYNAALALGVPSTLTLNYFLQMKAGEGAAEAPAPVQRDTPRAAAKAPESPAAAPPTPVAPAPEIPDDDEDEEEEEEEEEEDQPQLPPDDEESEDEPPPGLPSRGGYDDEDDDEDQPPPPPRGFDIEDDAEFEQDEDEDEDAPPPPLPSRR